MSHSPMGWLIAPWSQPSYDHSVGLGVEPTFTSGTSLAFDLSNLNSAVVTFLSCSSSTDTPPHLVCYLATVPSPSHVLPSPSNILIKSCSPNHYTCYCFWMFMKSRNLCAPCFYFPLFSELCFKVHVHFLSHAIYVALKLCTEEVCSASWYMNAE